MKSSRLRIVEVGPRDGLQNEVTLVSLTEKVQLIRSLLDCGLLSRQQVLYALIEVHKGKTVKNS